MLTELQQLADEYSDFYKEAHGFRPRRDTSAWTVEDYMSEFESLTNICEANRLLRDESEQAAIVEVEARIEKLIAIGAADRAVAIRWLAEGEEVNGDMEYLCYKLGLPYYYFQ